MNNKTYVYKGPSDGISHTALVAKAKSEARLQTDHTGPWELVSADYCFGELLNEKGKVEGPEAKVILRAI